MRRGSRKSEGADPQQAATPEEHLRQRDAGDWWVIGATVAMAIFVGAQAALLWLQNGLARQNREVMLIGTRAAQASAEAAERHAAVAETLARQERPWLLPEPDGPFDGWQWEWPDGEVLIRLTLRWSVRNYGRTLGWITAGSVVVFDVVDQPFSEVPPYEPGPPFVEKVLPPSGVHSGEIPLFIERAQHEKLVRTEAALMLMGQIVYRDVLGEAHTSAFAFQWTVPVLQLSPDLGFAYGPGGHPSWTRYT